MSRHATRLPAPDRLIGWKEAEMKHVLPLTLVSVALSLLASVVVSTARRPSGASVTDAPPLPEEVA